MTDLMKKSKGWFIAAGALLIVVGMAAIALPFIAAIAIEALVGWILIISGVVQVIHSFRALSTGKCILRLLSGILYLGIGIMFLVYPLQGVLTLTLLLAILFMFEGLMKITVSLQIKPAKNWGWLLTSGIAALVVAGIIWSGWPSTAAWVIGLLVGINLIFGGWTMLMLSAVAKDQEYEG